MRTPTTRTRRAPRALPLACVPDAIPAAERWRHVELVAERARERRPPALPPPEASITMTITSTLPATTDATFALDVAPGTGLVAVEFSAEWCAPCHAFAPVVEEAARAYAGRLRVLQMDTVESPATMVRFGVRALPTLLVFRDGVEVDRVVGAVPLARLRERLDRIVGPAER